MTDTDHDSVWGGTEQDAAKPKPQQITAGEAWMAMGADPKYTPKKPDAIAFGKILFAMNLLGLLMIVDDVEALSPNERDRIYRARLERSQARARVLAEAGARARSRAGEPTLDPTEPSPAESERSRAEPDPPYRRLA